MLSDHDETTRFAFVREGSVSGGETMARLLRQRGTTAETRVTVLSDSDAGLRAMQRAAAPEAESVLDWFHIAMRWLLTIWRWQFELAQKRKSLMPRAAVVAFGYCDRWFPIGKPFDLVVLGKKTL